MHKIIPKYFFNVMVIKILISWKDEGGEPSLPCLALALKSSRYFARNYRKRLHFVCSRDCNVINDKPF